MKRELLTDDELDMVTAGARTVQDPNQAFVAEKNDSPAWLEDIKNEMNLAELVPVNRGSFTQKLKGIFQRMQLD